MDDAANIVNKWDARRQVVSGNEIFSLSKEWDRLISFLTAVYMDLPRGEHFKAYINPCLNAANLSNLGFNIGPVCISAICIADDTYM